MRMGIETARVPLDQALQQVHRPPELAGIPKRDRFLDRIPRVRIIAPRQQLLKLKASPRAARGHLNQRHRHSTVDLTPVLITRNPPPPIEQLQRPTDQLDCSRRIDQPTRISPPAGRHRGEATQPSAIAQMRHSTKRSCPRHTPSRA